MEHATTDQDGFAVMALTGDVDFNSSPELRTELLELIEARRDFGLVAVGGTPLRVLQVAQLEKIFPMYATVADGVAAKA